MSSASETEEFYDAEDNSIERIARCHRRSSGSADKVCSENNSIVKSPPLQEIDTFKRPDSPSVIGENNKLSKDAEKKIQDTEKRRRRVEEMRRRIQNEDDDGNDYPSLPGSQTSSMDGLFAILETRSNPSATPSTVGDADSNSIMSLGTVGTILSGVETTSLHEVHRSESKEDTSSLNEQDGTRVPLLLQEPDVVASAKAAERPSGEPRFVAPVAPPRRKRKPKVAPPSKPSTLDVKGITEATPVQCTGLPSPASTIESLTKEFEHSLDLKSAIQGQYVVKPQDEENAKSGGPPPFEYVLIDQAGNIIGEDGLSKQLNMMVRTKTDSGKKLTDLEILEQVMVLNLDTGESIPLSLAEERIPRCLNPLSLHIMRLTSEYVSNSSLEKDKESDDDGDDVKTKTTQSDSAESSGAKRKTRTQIKKLFNKTVERTVNKIKSVADHTRHHEETIVESSEDEPSGDSRHSMKFKCSSSHKGPYEFDSLKLVQDLSGEHSGPVWTMKFSSCGKLLVNLFLIFSQDKCGNQVSPLLYGNSVQATAGQDHILRIWVLRDAHNYFNDMRTKYNAEAKVSPTPSQESLWSHQSAEGNDRTASASDQLLTDDPDGKSPFMPKPFCMYYGHTADLLDVSWSKNYFILSSSMDKTVRLWHISRKECLCCFQHIDFVTAIAFHPRDDRYFLSGSLDGKLRLWNIPDKKVALWNELDGQTKLITAASFCQNGKFAVVGSYDGRCIFYNTEQLKYYTQIHVRSTRGKNAKGRKISGIEAMPGEDKILVTSNDSRIRLYDLRDLSLTCKYKGYANLSSQIRASFSHDGKYIISGSENQCVYTWQTSHDYSKFSSARRDRNDYWEGIKSHNAMVTVAIFAPNPSVIFAQLEKDKVGGAGGEPNLAKSQGDHEGYVLVSADFTGGIKIFVSKSRSKFAATM